MSQDLVYRLRTCAAAILATDYKSSWAELVTDDAASLLIEAANTLDVPEDLGEPMEILPPPPTMAQSGAAWTTMELPTATPKACPSCGEISPRTVRRAKRKLMLECPSCGATWEWRP